MNSQDTHAQAVGRDEIEAASLDPDHIEVETREREFVPDYGNC